MVGIGLQHFVRFFSGSLATIEPFQVLSVFYEVFHSQLSTLTEAFEKMLPRCCHKIRSALATIHHCLLTSAISTVDQDALFFHGDVATLDNDLACTLIKSKTDTVEKVRDERVVVVRDQII